MENSSYLLQLRRGGEDLQTTASVENQPLICLPKDDGGSLLKTKTRHILSATFEVVADERRYKYIVAKKE